MVFDKYDWIAGFIFYLRLAAMRWVPTNEFPAIISPFCSSKKEENHARLTIKYPQKSVDIHVLTLCIPKRDG
jgi:hypothetical protein